MNILFCFKIVFIRVKEKFVYFDYNFYFSQKKILFTSKVVFICNKENFSCAKSKLSVRQRNNFFASNLLPT